MLDTPHQKTAALLCPLLPCPSFPRWSGLAAGTEAQPDDAAAAAVVVAAAAAVAAAVASRTAAAAAAPVQCTAGSSQVLVAQWILPGTVLILTMLADGQQTAASYMFGQAVRT